MFIKAIAIGGTGCAGKGRAVPALHKAWFLGSAQTIVKRRACRESGTGVLVPRLARECPRTLRIANSSCPETEQEEAQ